MKHSIRDELHWVLLFVVSLWVVAGLDAIIPLDFNDYGLRPRSIGGLLGIPLMTFLHGSWGHLFSNSIPLLILLTLLAGSRANSLVVVIGLMLMGGALLWLFGRSRIHIGASLLVYGLVGYLIAAGFIERRPISIIVAVIVGLLYGTTILWGVLPTAGKDVSWDGHLCGALAGIGLAYAAVGWQTETEQTYADQLENR
jgi:membrane associated rhomboid family serine protease